MLRTAMIGHLHSHTLGATAGIESDCQNCKTLLVGSIYDFRVSLLSDSTPVHWALVKLDSPALYNDVVTWWLDRGRELLRSDITFVRSIEIPTSYRLEHGHIHSAVGRLHCAVTEKQVQAIWR